MGISTVCCVPSWAIEVIIKDEQGIICDGEEHKAELEFGRWTKDSGSKITFTRRDKNPEVATGRDNRLYYRPQSDAVSFGFKITGKDYECYHEGIDSTYWVTPGYFHLRCARRTSPKNVSPRCYVGGRSESGHFLR